MFNLNVLCDRPLEPRSRDDLSDATGTYWEFSLVWSRPPPWTRTFVLHHTPIKRWYSPLPRKRRRQLSSRRRRSRWSWILREKKKKEKKENPSPAGTTVTDTLDKFNLFDLNGQGSQKYTAQLVKPVKGSVMPVKKKRKLPGADDHEHKCKITSFTRPQIRGARPISSDKLFSSRKCLAWFHKYAGADKVVDPEAMERFCIDIDVEPENIVMLVLAWHLEAANMGFFTKEEWLRGMTVLQCDCTERLQSKLDYMRGELNDSVLFKNIYRYAFDFSRDRDQRSLDMDTAKSMLALLLGRTWPLFPIFHQFLEQSKYKGMNKDQWYNVLEFSRTINTDLSNYDEDGAWPVLLDEFVEWQKTWSAS